MPITTINDDNNNNHNNKHSNNNKNNNHRNIAIIALTVAIPISIIAIRSPGVQYSYFF